MVLLKIIAILVFITFASRFIHPPTGIRLLPMDAGNSHRRSIVFFTYIGFDSVSTAARNARTAARRSDRHHRHPGCLHAPLCWRSRRVNRTCAVADAGGRRRPGGQYAEKTSLHGRSPDRLNRRADGMISSLLVFQLGQARVWFAMSRDACCPASLAACTRASVRRIFLPGWPALWSEFLPAFSYRNPRRPFQHRTLFAFALVAAGVLILRYREPTDRVPSALPAARSPHHHHAYVRAPDGGLPITNWIRFFVWMAIGLVIYYNYGRRRSTLRAANPLRAILK